MSKRTSMLAGAAVPALILAACGGGGGGGGGGVAGIGGTGTGGVTGFGSVIVNDDKRLVTDGDTAFTIDGVTVTKAEFEVAANRGLVVRFEVGDDAESDGLVTADAETIAGFHQVKGPVTGTNPLTVLGQTVFCTGDTFVEDVASCGALTTADFAEVAGFADAAGIVQATRVEKKIAADLPTWKVVGEVGALGAGSFQIGGLTVLFVPAVVDNGCGALANGDLVEVKVTAGFAAPLTIDVDDSNNEKIECPAEGIANPGGDASATVIDGSIEGFVSSVTGAPVTRFVVNGQTVVVDAGTVYENGTNADIVVGAKLEAEGLFNTGTGVLTAEEIDFRQARMRVIAPVDPGDVTVGTSLDILGFTVLATPQTEDDDSVISAGLGGTRQVEVRGFVDGSGTVFAEEVRDRGAADLADVRLRGPAENIVNNVSFDILGVTVVTAGSLFFDENDAPISEADFFAALSAGAIVDVNNATYTEATNELDGAEISLED